MLLFRSEEHIDRWCAQRGTERGGVLSIEQLRGLARAWYAHRMHRDWRRHTPAEAQAVFTSLGLVGPFWQLAPR